MEKRENEVKNVCQTNGGGGLCVCLCVCVREMCVCVGELFVFAMKGYTI